MRSWVFPSWLPSLMLATITSGPAAASADVLMCQAKVTGYGPPTPPTQVSFQALAAGGNLPLTFEWDFGDGSSSLDQDPVHTYTQGGYYLVKMQVTDNSEPAQVCRDTTVILIQVFVDPLCGATATPRWGDAALTVDFTAYEALVGDPPPYTWSWRFGDGVTSSLQRPTYTYSTPGTYWAVATLHTTRGSYDCMPSLRVSAIPVPVASVAPASSPDELRLEPPRPNPFGGMTAFGFDLPRAGHARLVVVDVNGRLVAVVMDGYRPAGRNFAAWQGRSVGGRGIAPGLYLARLEYEGAAKSTRVVKLP